MTGRDPTCWGKMWDCKTSKMSQSPHAALNAFGLFAAAAPGRARAHVFAGWRPPLFRRRSPLHVGATCVKRFESSRADCGTSLDGVLRPWSLAPQPRARRFLDRTCVALRSMGCSTAVVRDHLPGRPPSSTTLGPVDRARLRGSSHRIAASARSWVRRFRPFRMQAKGSERVCLPVS